VRLDHLLSREQNKGSQSHLLLSILKEYNLMGL
jgi:hypothetical protein